MGPEQWELRSEREARKSEPKRRARSLSRVSSLRVIALNCFGGTQSNNISWNNVIYQRNCSAHRHEQKGIKNFMHYNYKYIHRLLHKNNTLIRSRGFGVRGTQSEKIFWDFPHAFSGKVSNIEIFTKIYIYRIRTAVRISTRNSSLEAHYQGLAGKGVKLGFGQVHWPWKGQMLVFQIINQPFDGECNKMETFLNK